MSCTYTSGRGDTTKMSVNHHALHNFAPRLASSKGSVLSASRKQIPSGYVKAAFDSFADFSDFGENQVNIFKKNADMVLEWGIDNMKISKTLDGLIMQHKDHMFAKGALYYIALGETHIHRLVYTIGEGDIYHSLVRLQNFESDFTLLSEWGRL